MIRFLWIGLLVSVAAGCRSTPAETALHRERYQRRVQIVRDQALTRLGTRLTEQEKQVIAKNAPQSRYYNGDHEFWWVLDQGWRVEVDLWEPTLDVWWNSDDAKLDPARSSVTLSQSSQ